MAASDRTLAAGRLAEDPQKENRCDPYTSGAYLLSCKCSWRESLVVARPALQQQQRAPSRMQPDGHHALSSSAQQLKRNHNVRRARSAIIVALRKRCPTGSLELRAHPACTPYPIDRERRTC